MWFLEEPPLLTAPPHTYTRGHAHICLSAQAAGAQTEGPLRQEEWAGSVVTHPTCLPLLFSAPGARSGYVERLWRPLLRIVRPAGHTGPS